MTRTQPDDGLRLRGIGQNVQEIGRGNKVEPGERQTFGFQIILKQCLNEWGREQRSLRVLLQDDISCGRCRAKALTQAHSLPGSAQLGLDPSM